MIKQGYTPLHPGCKHCSLSFGRKSSQEILEFDIFGFIRLQNYKYSSNFLGATLIKFSIIFLDKSILNISLHSGLASSIQENSIERIYFGQTFSDDVATSNEINFYH